MSVAPLRLPFVSERDARTISRTLEEPDWLLEQRLEAVARVAELPAEGNQLFTPYLDLRAVRWQSILPYTETGTSRAAHDAPLPRGASAFVAFDGDAVTARVLGEEARAAGVVIDTFANVLRGRPELLRDHLESGMTLPADDAFAQVCRAVWAHGLLIHVPAGARLTGPLVIRWSPGTPGRGLIARTLVTLGEGAQVRILEEQGPNGTDSTDGTVGTDGTDSTDSTDSGDAASLGPQRLWWGTTEVVLADGAMLELSGLQEFSRDTVAFVSRQATLGREARLRWALASVGSELHKSRIDNLLVGRGSSVQQVEIGFGGGSQLFDLTSYTRHIGEDTTGDLLSKGVFTDQSRGYIKGLIEIQRTARGTDSFLGEFSMLLARKSRSVTIPSLEIDQPDVRRASHSSSVAPIDEAQIFYLMSRGLDRETARKTIVMGFLEPVVARIPLPDVQDRLRGLLEEKWPAAVPVAA